MGYHTHFTDMETEACNSAFRQCLAFICNLDISRAAWYLMALIVFSCIHVHLSCKTQLLEKGVCIICEEIW